MMSLRQIFVFRHGETDWNKEGRFQGHLDVPINDTGREQARGLIPKLQTHALQAILSSDLIRARETAEIVAASLRVPVISHPGLREAHLGVAQGLCLQEIERNLGAELVTRWRSTHLTDADISYPGGESGTQVMERVFAAMEEFMGENPLERIGVATHGGVIRRIMQRVLPPGSDPVPIPNGVLYVLNFNERTKEWSPHAEHFRL